MTLRIAPDAQGTSTRPYLIRALHDWCTDNGFTPYVAVFVDASVQVPMEYVKNNEIVLNVGFEATSGAEAGQRVHRVQGALRRRRARDRRARSTMWWRSTRARTARAWPFRCPRVPGAAPADARPWCSPTRPTRSPAAACAWRPPRPTPRRRHTGAAMRRRRSRPNRPPGRRAGRRSSASSSRGPYNLDRCRPRRLSSVGRAPAL